MKITQTKLLVASALLFLTAESPALQPEVLYAFQLGPRNPHASLVQGSDGHFYGTTEFGGTSDYGTVFQVTTNGLVTTLVSFTGDNGRGPVAGLVLGSDGNFYGTTSQGGSSDESAGTVFQMTTNGILTSLVSFNITNGRSPQAGLVLGKDGHFYGTTSQGGSGLFGYGTVFKVTTNGELTSLVSFNNTNGARPVANLVLGSDGNFYGTTPDGGSTIGNPTNPYGFGTVFRVTTNGELTSLVSFNNANGANPHSGLVLGTDGNFYGTTVQGGTTVVTPYGLGTVFRVTHNGMLTSLFSFTGANGEYPYAALVIGRDNNFYGTAQHGVGSNYYYGTVFKVTTNGALTSLVSFAGTNGANPQAALVLGSDGDFYGTTPQGGSGTGGTAFKVSTDGVLTSLVSFARTNGAYPNELVLGNDGNFYGTTSVGGSSDSGTLFKVTRNGVLTTLVEFSRTNGANPEGGLLLGSDGSFYGTTTYGGSHVDSNNPGYGTVFKVTTNGVLTTLVDFNFANGAWPQAGLVFGFEGKFYGTTHGGGSGDADGGLGTVFQVTSNEVFTPLVSFYLTNGGRPRAELVLGNDGSFYGTTGGTYPHGFGGTVFRVTTNGMITSLVSFKYANGLNPQNGMTPEAGLIQGNDGNFYGTTAYGGSHAGDGGRGLGTVFMVTTNGVLSTLVSFTGDNGGTPQARLLLGRDGNFYGTTEYGGSNGYGTVFKVTTNGVLTSLISFAGSNGANPQAGLVLGSDGIFYGTTSSGGPGGGGTIFRLVISAFTSVARQPDGNVLLTGTGPFNGSYRLWASTDLSLPTSSWTLLTSASFDSNGNFSYTDAAAATNPSRFYQVSIP